MPHAEDGLPSEGAQGQKTPVVESVFLVVLFLKILRVAHLALVVVVAVFAAPEVIV